jgi:hypothetical protein
MRSVLGGADGSWGSGWRLPVGPVLRSAALLFLADSRTAAAVPGVVTTTHGVIPILLEHVVHAPCGSRPGPSLHGFLAVEGSSLPAAGTVAHHRRSWADSLPASTGFKAVVAAGRQRPRRRWRRSGSVRLPTLVVGITSPAGGGAGGRDADASRSRRSTSRPSRALNAASWCGRFAARRSHGWGSCVPTDGPAWLSVRCGRRRDRLHLTLDEIAASD